MAFDANVFMPLSYAQDVIEAMADGQVKSCLLIGGEPTLYPYLAKVIQFIRQNTKIKTTLITNGRKLASQEYLKQLIDAGLQRVVISIEGSSALIHNTITRAKSYAQK